MGSFSIWHWLVVGIIILLHAAILTGSGLNPVRFYQKVLPVLTFAFTSRSSAAPSSITLELSLAATPRALGRLAMRATMLSTAARSSSAVIS